MKIAVIAPPWFTIPPVGQGGVQSIVDVLVEELVRQGERVLLYSVGGTRTSAELRYLFDREQKDVLATKPQSAVDSAHVAFALSDARASGVDVIHDHSGRIGPTVGAFASGLPMLHTVHTSLHGAAKLLYGSLPQRPGFGLSAISERQRAQAPEVPFLGTVHNGIEAHAFPFHRAKGDYLVMLSRITPDKGCHIAMDVARRAGIPFKLAGRPEPTALGRAYFENEITPRLGEGLEYLGPLGPEEKVPLLAHARALLLPAQWEEPFSMVVLEAWACGTPVIVSSRGALPELVRDGVDGFVRDDPTGMLDAIDHLSELDPAHCRERAERDFSPSRLVAGYRKLYGQLLSDGP
ncbi:glycosyltransferase [Streptomyces sp. TP-A0356]|uniref:glycosyltransferase n=1 Tax=Streptomyces sp. TP-A0356 TaxID=1359208 RepID=UPI00131B6062|nr:glycosyltransferase [Streptomyces sp. TP-A0356]